MSDLKTNYGQRSKQQRDFKKYVLVKGDLQNSIILWGNRHFEVLLKNINGNHIQYILMFYIPYFYSLVKTDVPFWLIAIIIVIGIISLVIVLAIVAVIITLKSRDRTNNNLWCVFDPSLPTVAQFNSMDWTGLPQINLKFSANSFALSHTVSALVLVRMRAQDSQSTWAQLNLISTSQSH